MSVSMALGDAGFADVVLQSSDWGFVRDNWRYLAGGLWWTVCLTLTSITLGFLFGFPAGAIEVYGDGILASLVRTAGVVMRGTPIVVILIFAYFVLPVNDLLPFHRFTPVSDAFVAATVGLGLRSAAYQAQLFRGAIRSVSGGQMEAARSIGLSKVDSVRYVVVPQALRRSIPGFQNEFTIVLKDTSVAIAIGLAELLTRSQDLFVQQTTAITEIILAISLVYFVITFGTNRALDYVGSRYEIPGETS